MCDFDVPKYLHLLSAIAQVLVLAFFTAMFRVLVGIPRMSLGHLSEHELYTHIRAHWGVIGHARLLMPSNRLLGSHSFVDLQDLSIYCLPA